MTDQTDATHLEPLAKGAVSREAAALISIAVSLKRIADAIDGDQYNAGMKHSLSAIADRMPS